MVVTRSSREEKEPNDDIPEESVKDVASAVARDDGAQKSERRRSRERRRKKRDDMKSRNTGVGLSISTEATNQSIVFDDDVNVDDQDEDEITRDEENSPGDGPATAHNDDASDEDEEDDAIEEVESRVARDEAMKQLANERQTAKEQRLETRTKKRKKTSATVEEEDGFDDDFFAQVDAEIAERRKQKKLKESAPVGRHIAFLSMDDEEDSGPIQAEHNIELVVLGDDALEGSARNSSMQRIAGDKAGIEPSGESHVFARGQLASGKDEAKRRGNKKNGDTGWKRSKKMNVLAFGRHKAKRKRGLGAAAATFVVKSFEEH